MAALALVVRWWRPLAALALAAATVWGYLHWRGVQREIGEAAADARWTVAIEAQKTKARAQFDAANERVRIAENTASAARSEQNRKDMENAKIIADLGLQLHDARGLRDPYAKPGRCGSGGASLRAASAPSAAPGGTDPAETPGLLSAQFAGMLRDWVAEADAINIAYASSREDAATLRGLLKACGPAQ
jgi:hypothetical protein